MALIDDLLFYIDNPFAFVEDIIGAKPTWQQEKLLKAVAGNNALSVKSGHSVGKTAVEAWVVLWFLVLHPYSRIPCTAPTGHQLDDVLWPEIKYWLDKSQIKNKLEWTKTRLSMKGFKDTWFAAPVSTSQPDNLQGFHGQHILFVVDEASGIEQKTMEVIEGALTNEGAKLLMMGNPTQITGSFYNSFHRDRELYKNFTFNSEDSPLVSPEYPQRQAKKYGKDSDVYRVRVKGQFPRGGKNTLINLDQLEDAAHNVVEKSGKIVLGVDPARFGDDESVICYRWGYYVYPFRVFQGIDTTRLTGEVILLIKQIRAHKYKALVEVRVDETGIGAGVVDQLRLMEKKYNFVVIPVLFGGAGNEDYSNLASLMWGTVKELLPELHLPEDDELNKQLTTRRYRIMPDGKIKIEEKDVMKKRGLKSPDKADALCLSLADVSAPKLGEQKVKRKPLTSGFRKERF